MENLLLIVRICAFKFNIMFFMPKVIEVKIFRPTIGNEPFNDNYCYYHFMDFFLKNQES